MLNHVRIMLEQPHDKCVWLMIQAMLSFGARDAGLDEITSREEELLRAEVEEAISELSREEALDFNNRMVAKMRAVIVHSVTREGQQQLKQRIKRNERSMAALGEYWRHPGGWRDRYLSYKPIQVRPGLRLPLVWAAQAERLAQEEPTTLFAAILSNALHENAPAGETELWSPH